MELLHRSGFSATSEGAAGITCHQLLAERRLLFAGLANGSIAMWRRRQHETSGHSDGRPQVLKGHSGLVRSMLAVQHSGLGQEGFLLFSSSADRTIRVWDPAVRDLAKACVQTIRGHGGTVTGLAYCDGVLISSSTDCTIRVWKADDGRQLLLYPWFSPHLTLTDISCWVNCLALQMGEGSALYAGDEHGALSVYKIKAAASRASSFALEKSRRHAHAHSLGITRLLLVPQARRLSAAGVIGGQGLLSPARASRRSTQLSRLRTTAWCAYTTR